MSKAQNNNKRGGALGEESRSDPVVETKAKIVNQLRRWYMAKGFDNQAHAAESLGASREDINRILKGQVQGISLDKLVRLGDLVGCKVQIGSRLKLELTEGVSQWMGGLLEHSAVTLQNSVPRFRPDDEGAMMASLSELLEEHRPGDGNASVVMICSGKKWDLDMSQAYYQRHAEIAKANGLELEKLFVAETKGLEHTRALARLSANAGIKTSVLEVCNPADYAYYLPPPGVGFWILGDERIVIHSAADGEFAVEEVHDRPIAAYLVCQVFEPARASAIELGLAGVTALR
jgi:predicted XRE-type DNA-binding protein